MNDASVPISTRPLVRLGVRGLPNLTDNMISGGLYVLLAETPSARFPILAENLANATKDGFPCFIVLPSNPEGFLQRVEVVGAFNSLELIAADRLQLFMMQEEFSKKMFRFGAEAFVSELEQFGISQNSYILFDQADDVLSLHDITLAMEQINVLKNWFSKHNVTALLVFSRVTSANSSAINALMDSTNGMVRLGGGEEGLKLTFEYWQSPEGTIAARSYRLSTQGSGRYEAVAHAEQLAVTGKIESALEVEDAQVLYFYMNPDLGSLAKQMPGEWKLVDTLVGMLHATRNTRSSTSILVYQRDTNVRQLAETIHTLRTSLGRHAKIIVQEKDASLRYQNEALLLKLGLNLVVYRDVPPSRFPLMLEAMGKQVFAKDIDINFEAALASVLTTTASGYLIPSRFVREVKVIIDRGATLDIPCAMVVGRPTQNTSVIEILKTSGLSRPGDLITSDGENCFIFLNACPESVILKTLLRIFKMPVESAIQDVRFLVRNTDIQADLSALVRGGDVFDYTVEIGGVMVSETILPSPEPVSHTVASGVVPQPPIPAFAEKPLREPVVEEVEEVEELGGASGVAAVLAPVAKSDHISARAADVTPPLRSVASVDAGSSPVAPIRTEGAPKPSALGLDFAHTVKSVANGLATKDHNPATPIDVGVVRPEAVTLKHATRATRSKPVGSKT